ncbi:hypothetical protein J3Q64DRAFT_1739230 [Phycomyces blakesleeanus]|uniref:Uncharacterized protein n=1 Tax=Phycomyces blakesleeanus TaxID=4837 RepID=A0ABR3B086_PHYBL
MEIAMEMEAEVVLIVIIMVIMAAVVIMPVTMEVQAQAQVQTEVVVVVVVVVDNILHPFIKMHKISLSCPCDHLMPVLMKCLPWDHTCLHLSPDHVLLPEAVICRARYMIHNTCRLAQEVQMHISFVSNTNSYNNNSSSSYNSNKHYNSSR